MCGDGTTPSLLHVWFIASSFIDNTFLARSRARSLSSSLSHALSLSFSRIYNRMNIFFTPDHQYNKVPGDGEYVASHEDHSISWYIPEDAKQWKWQASDPHTPAPPSTSFWPTFGCEHGHTDHDGVLRDPTSGVASATGNALLQLMITGDRQ